MDTGDEGGEELARALARVIAPMRATSRFAIETFLQAVEEGMVGAELTIHAPNRRGDLPEASVVVDPRSH